MNTKNLITNTGRGLAYLALASGLVGCNLSTPVNQKEALINEYNSRFNEPNSKSIPVENQFYAEDKAEAEPIQITTDQITTDYFTFNEPNLSKFNEPNLK